MKYQDLLNTIERGDIGSLYYMYGDEPYLMERLVRRIVERLVPPDMRDFNLNVFYGAENKGEEIAEAAATIPMFSSRRVVLVRKADELSAASQEILLSCVRNPSPSTCLLFVGEKTDQRKRFFAEIKKGGALVEFRRLYENQLPAFIRNEVSLLGKRLEAAAGEMLAHLVGNNLGELVSELEKVSLFVGQRDVITVADIRSVVSDTKINSVFELTDAIGGRMPDKAMRSLDTLLRGGEAPLVIVAMIARHFRQLWKVRELMDRGTPARDIGNKAGINPYFLQGIIRQAGNFKVAELKAVFKKLHGVDMALKSTRLKPDIHLRDFLFEVCRQGEAERPT